MTQITSTILCITPNANIERVWEVPGLQLGQVLRARRSMDLPSGKGNNVARAIRTLGGQAACAGFVGGHTGRRIADLMETAGIPARWTWVEGESRLTVVLADPTRADLEVTVISDNGPEQGRGDWRRLQEDALALADGAQLACLCGSAGPGSPLDEVATLVKLLQSRGVPVWVDCAGTMAEAAISARPAGLKVNLREAYGILGRDLEGVDGAGQAALDLRRRGVETVIITLGSDGAVLSSAEGEWHGVSPSVRAISTVGSGDAFLAAWLHALEQGLPGEEGLRYGLAAGAANAMMLGACRFEREAFLACLEGATVRQTSPGQ